MAEHPLHMQQTSGPDCNKIVNSAQAQGDKMYNTKIFAAEMLGARSRVVVLVWFKGMERGWQLNLNNFKVELTQILRSSDQFQLATSILSFLLLCCSTAFIVGRHVSRYSCSEKFNFLVEVDFHRGLPGNICGSRVISKDKGICNPLIDKVYMDHAKQTL